VSAIFSIILPTYNRAYVLWRALESVVAQTETRWELIVVDDGSTDGTARLLEEFRDDRIRSVKTSNRGPSAARNRGLEIARAPYVAYLDSDNTWHANFLEVMGRAVSEDDGAVLWYCGQNTTVWERSADGVWSLIARKAEPRRQYAARDVWRLQSADTNCIVHRRAVLERVCGWDEDCRWIEDLDFFLRVFLAYPGQVRWVPHVLVEYRQVFGEGADGICGEAREDRDAEVRGRRYLLRKWGRHPEFAAAERLNVRAEDLSAVRAKV
jgi:glycosyltransferase involved in cell wall biosynthesis